MRTKHGLRNHPLYVHWGCMRNRVTSNKGYIAKGITICDDWESVETFIKDMYPTYIPGLSLDRKDNNLGYSPQNCRWVVRCIQAQNTAELMSTNSSGYRGVNWDSKRQMWRTRIAVNGKRISLGWHISALAAGIAYNKYVQDNKLEHTLNSIKEIL